MFFPISVWCSLALFISPTLANGKNAKRGLAFAAGDTPGDLVNANQTKSVISWIYDWGSLPLDYMAESNLVYVPMQWGAGSINNIGASIKTQGAKVMLGFNEPDFVNESNMNATTAAGLWMQYIQPLKQAGVRLGAPAVTAAPTGIPWLKDFMAACTNCTFDFIPFHWYGSGVGSFLDYLGQMHGTFPQHPLWVTEFAETSLNDTVVADFLNATTTYMDGQDWVERYAWFGYFRPKTGLHYNLLDQNGGLNALGQMYVGAKTIHTQVVTSPSGGPGYSTVNGADGPSQAHPTAFPAATNGAASTGPFLMNPTWGLGFPSVISAIVAAWTLL